jgi:CRISPR-associated protein Csb2
MATVLQLRFPGGQYHATPWGHHVNEGLVEWPPSPWRLLRALLATGFAKCGWPSEGPPLTARRLVESLAGHLPVFALPSVALAHSRHYVDAAGKKPLILDTWARVEAADEPLEVSWDIDLPPDERALLAELAPLLGYLGRAESWVVAQLAQRPTRAPNCFPASEDGPRDLGFEAVRVLCSQSAEAYSAWYSKRTSHIDSEWPAPPGKKLPAKQSKERAKALLPYPADLLAAMCAETGWLQKHGWSAAPGSREVTYWRRTDAFVARPPMPRPQPDESLATIALVALATPSRNLSALPSVVRTFPQGRLFHRALAAVLNRVNAKSASTCLLGRVDDEPARHGHKHAHLLHLDLDDDQRLDHALVWAPMGLDSEARDVLRAVRRTWMKGGVGELQVALAAIGSPALIRPLHERLGTTLLRTLGPPGGAVVWRSATPFVPPRFTKKQGKDSLVGQVQEGLARRGLPAASVEVLDRRADLTLSFRHFILHDQRMSPPMATTYALRLTFASPVEGPVCLGYGSHYGLGRFETE